MTTSDPAVDRRRAPYLSQGPFSDPRDLAGRLQAMVARAGTRPAALAAAVRSLMVHVHWRKSYGLPDDPARADAETNIRDLRTRLARIGERAAFLGRPADDVSPLSLAERVIGNCRDHALFFAALLRVANVPARVRCGFGGYFSPDHWEDHWVVERWDKNRWAVSDPQLDRHMIEVLGVKFDPMDLPAGAFVSGGEAWLACRRGDDPDRYGIFHFHGWDFVKGNLVRDLSALAKRELLPWDCWGAILKPHAAMSGAELERLDEAARATPMQVDRDYDGLAELAGRPEFRLPRRIKSWPQGQREVEIDLRPILEA